MLFGILNTIQVCTLKSVCLVTLFYVVMLFVVIAIYVITTADIGPVFAMVKS